MSWNKINVYGLLDRFQIRTQQEVFKFNQIDNDFNNYQNSIWIQSERDELNYQINKMFKQVKEWLGFYPRPIWKEIKVPIDNYYFYTNQTYKIPESAYLLDFGVRATELIEDNVTFTTGGSPTTATIEVITNEIVSGEIALFHKSNDTTINATADERFRIHHTSVYYDTNKYIFKVPYARLIKPNLWLTEYENNDPQQRKSYSPSTSSNFVTEVDVYRVYNDNTTKAKLIGVPYNLSGITTLLEKEVDVIVTDSYDAEFRIVENETFPTFDPIEVLLYTYIGMPLDEDGNMQNEIEEMIIRKAKVEMGINARLSAAKISTQWDFDELPAYTKNDPNSGRGGVGFMPNPIGSLNVDIEMFKRFLPIANWRGTITDERFWIK